jgi:deoxyguanosine kinase
MIISIEGNIGSGKSTLVKILKKKLECDDRFVFIPEPVDEWLKITDNTGESILSKFYNDQERYAFVFQILTYTTKMKLIKEAIAKNPNKIIITERSIYTDKEVFAKMLHNEDKIEDIVYNIYKMMFEQFVDHETEVNKIIYVCTTAEKCYERINKRHRDGENTIQLEYLEKCCLYHHNWLSKSDNVNTVLTLDGNAEFEHDDQLINVWVKKIINFVECEYTLLYSN